MTPEEAHDFQQGWDRSKEGPGDVPTVVEEAEAVVVNPKVCSQCGNVGYVTVAEHDPWCTGDERRCLTTCPVPAQAVCPSCTESQRPTVTDQDVPF